MTTTPRTPCVRLGTLMTTGLVTGVLALGLAGCAGGGSGDSGSGGGLAAEPAARSAQDTAEAGAPLADAAQGDAIGKVATDADPSTRISEAAFLGRDVIATAQVTVRTSEVSKARDRVGDLVRRYVGYVAEETTERDRHGDTIRSVLRLRIPTERFDQALDDLEGLAPGVDVDRSTEDVTQQVVDVASRIRTQEISLGRLRRFLDRATTVEDIVRLEAEIARREGDLGSLRAQQRQLSDLTAESTITVRLQHVSPAPGKAEHRDTGFLAGLSTGWDAFTTSLVGLSQGVGVVLPFAVVLAILLGPVVAWLRRRRTVRVVPAE